jgi:hypothetical protein
MAADLLTARAPRGCDGIGVAQAAIRFGAKRAHRDAGPTEAGSRKDEETIMSLSMLLIIVLILLLIGAFPSWGYSRSWGYRPVGGLGVILIIVIVLLLLGVI